MSVAKDKGQCQFAMEATNQPRCSKPATTKWGEHWFCAEHGRRNLPTVTDLKRGAKRFRLSVAAFFRRRCRLLESDGRFTPQWRPWWLPFWLGVRTPRGRVCWQQRRSLAEAALRTYVIRDRRKPRPHIKLDVHRLTHEDLWRH